MTAQICILAFQPIDAGYNKVIDNTVIGLGDTILNFKELFAVDDGPNVLLTVDYAFRCFFARL